MQKNPLLTWLCASILMAPIALYAAVELPPSVKVQPGKGEPACSFNMPEWREAQEIEGVKIQESIRCLPDNPYTVASLVKGTNNTSMTTLMETYLAADSVIKKNDMDGDGDPDLIIIRLEVAELNGHSPDFQGVVPTFDIAPGVQPGMWVFAPKSRGMATKSFVGLEANPLLRSPSPVIRVEQDDIVWIKLENTHYFPHTIHLHGVDHPFVDSTGEGNDGVPQTSEQVVMPGESRTYEIKPRVAGTFVYHCHVQTHVHLAMGLVGMLIVEENRPNNWLQTYNVGGGQVRHPSKAVLEEYDSEYDLHYHAMDKELHNIIQDYNDPRVIAKKMNREYDISASTDEYYTLNGRSFPYTIRESLIVTEPDKNIKVRLFNSASEMVAIHTHGHKATITHYDGVEHNPSAQIMRDIYDVAPAQRNDLKINTTDDGLHSYGEGIWIFHDHREKGITTDGQNPGGNVSAIVYKSFLNENGIPKVQGTDIKPLFTSEFFQRRVPVWQDLDKWNSLGEVDQEGYSQKPAFVPTIKEMRKAPGKQKPNTVVVEGENNSFRNFMVGLLLGIFSYLLILNREKVLSMIKPLISSNKGGQ